MRCIQRMAAVTLLALSAGCTADIGLVGTWAHSAVYDDNGTPCGGQTDSFVFDSSGEYAANTIINYCDEGYYGYNDDVTVRVENLGYWSAFFMGDGRIGLHLYQVFSSSIYESGGTGEWSDYAGTVESTWITALGRDDQGRFLWIAPWDSEQEGVIFYEADSVPLN